jgi:hypothetical protein
VDIVEGTWFSMAAATMRIIRLGKSLLEEEHAGESKSIEDSSTTTAW